VIARTHHIAESQQGLHDLIRIAGTWDFHQRAVRQWHAHKLALAAIAIFYWEKSTVPTGCSDSYLAVGTGSIAVGKGRDNKITFRNVTHLVANLFYDTDKLMAYGTTYWKLSLPTIVPEIRTTNTGQHNTHDRIGRIFDGWVWSFADLNLPGALKNCCFHYVHPFFRPGTYNLETHPLRVKVGSSFPDDQP
jgi:hypothetical protein